MSTKHRETSTKNRAFLLWLGARCPADFLLISLLSLIELSIRFDRRSRLSWLKVRSLGSDFGGTKDCWHVWTFVDMKIMDCHMGT